MARELNLGQDCHLPPTGEDVTREMRGDMPSLPPSREREKCECIMDHGEGREGMAQPYVQKSETAHGINEKQKKKKIKKKKTKKVKLKATCASILSQR